MLTLYGARECIDKEKFIYDKIGSSDRESLVLVPNQYTLVAEEQAVKYLGTDCLFDTEILSMNRLGQRILTEKGLESVEMLSRYGRLMLLTRIVAEHKDELELFAKSAGKLTFTQMLDDFLVSFKQQNCSFEQLEEMIDDEKVNVILRKKLSELKGIIADYESAIAGKYTDSEDYINMYIDAIPDCRIARDKDIWIYGYDSITPKFMRSMFELSKVANSVNLIINESDTGLDEKVRAAIYAKASEEGIAISEEAIPEEFSLEKSETISRIEKGLCAGVITDEAIAENKDYEPEGLELVRCANQYYEAENAAAYIHRLIRDEGYALKDITVICNSEDKLQPVVKRALQEYGLPVFLDASRAITDSAGAVLMYNLLFALRYEYNTNAIFALLKTGLAGLSAEDIDDLENYAREYNIQGSMWARTFKYGAHDLGDTELARLDAIRAEIIAPIQKLMKIAEDTDTSGEFTEKFRQFLEDEYNLSERNEAKALEQESRNLLEDAQRTRVSLDEALKLLAQIKEIMDDYPLDIAEFMDIYTTGLRSEEIGVIPPSLDGLSMGTLIRTRPRPGRAVLILGANEGILPLQPSPEGLFSADEKAYFKEMDFAVGELDELKMQEESTALYRMLSHPSEKLYVSYSLTDIEGNELFPSTLIDSMKMFFPKLESKKDIVSNGWGMDLVSDREETLRHLINHIKDRNTERGGDELTRALLGWYSENEPELLATMLDAARDENEQERLKVELTRGIYAQKDGNFKVSASKIGKFFECPFAYYVGYGLAPREERSYSSDPRSIGDIYHKCLEAVATEAIRRKKAGEELDDEELRKLVDEEIFKIAEDYLGGLFLSTKAEEYRLERIRGICLGAAMAVAEQIETGAIEDVLVEERFGRKCKFKPIEIDVNGDKVYIEGIIDRADIMSDSKLRIVDYKTGHDRVDVHRMKQGYKMQLMIYLMSATQEKYEPAGIFYFNIAENIENFNSNTAEAQNNKLNEEPKDKFKLRGKYVDEPGVLDMMPKAVLSGRELAIEPDAFAELKEAVRQNLCDIADRMVGGDIQISPLRTGNNRMSCAYCDYKAICRYDSSNAGNRSREIKGAPRKKKNK